MELTGLIVAAVILLTLLGAAYGLKTRRGSGINDHPKTDTGDPARDPVDPQADQTAEEDRPDTTLLDQRGKK